MTRVPTQSWLPESKVPGSLSYGGHACTRKEPLDRKAYLLYSLETYVSTHRPDEFKVARVGVLYFGLDIFLLFFLWPQVLDYYTFFVFGQVLDKTSNVFNFWSKKFYLKNIAVHETSVRLGYREMYVCAFHELL